MGAALLLSQFARHRKEQAMRGKVKGRGQPGTPASHHDRWGRCCCGCLSGKKKFSIGASGGFAVITYLINAYAPMVESLRPWRRYSPFYYYNGNTVISNGLNPVHVLVLAGLIAVFFCAALFFFNRRNLSC